MRKKTRFFRTPLPGGVCTPPIGGDPLQRGQRPPHMGNPLARGWHPLTVGVISI